MTTPQNPLEHPLLLALEVIRTFPGWRETVLGNTAQCCTPLILPPFLWSSRQFSSCGATGCARVDADGRQNRDGHVHRQVESVFAIVMIWFVVLN